MNQTWENRIREFWVSADDTKVNQTLDGMKDLVAELDPDDPRGVFELASAHDFVGLEDDAIPLYERALELGLAGLNREEAVIQLASSLRNIGKPQEAIAWLESEMYSEPFRMPAKAFLVLAQHDLGLEVDIDWLEKYPEDALYARSIGYYYQAIKNS